MWQQRQYRTARASYRPGGKSASGRTPAVKYIQRCCNVYWTAACADVNAALTSSNRLNLYFKNTLLLR